MNTDHECGLLPTHEIMRLLNHIKHPIVVVFI